MSNAFVCLMGMGTVFVGLICIVFVCSIMSLVVRSLTGKSKKEEQKATPVVSAAPTEIKDKQAIIAGTCAVIAEELGTDVKNIRVLSFKRAN